MRFRRTWVASGPKGSVVTFTVGAVGTAGLLKATINAGIDPQTGQPSAAMSATAKWWVPTTVKALEVGCVGETTQSDPTYGSTAITNAVVRDLDALAGGAISGPLVFPDGAGEFSLTQAARGSAGAGNAAVVKAQAGLSTNDGGTLTLSGGDRAGATKRQGDTRIDLGPVASGDGLSGKFKLLNGVSGSALELQYDDGSISTLAAMRVGGGDLGPRLIVAQEVGFTNQFGSRPIAITNPGASYAIDWSKGNVRDLGPLAADINPLTFTGNVDGFIYTISFVQDGIGGWAVTWHTSFKFGLISNTVDGTVSKVTVFQFLSRGGNLVALNRNVY